MRVLTVLAFVAVFMPSAAAAQLCGDGPAGFPAWLQDFKQHAVKAGISKGTVEAALAKAAYDRKIIAQDRSQKSFKLSFEEFKQRRAPAGTIALGRKHLKSNASLLSKIEAAYGVQPEILVSIWGLESGFGRYLGNISLFTSLPTLAYDCRRSDFFTNELFSALVIADRRYMEISQMKGAWAGEIGQTQFLASNYARFAVDFDRDGRRDLINSKADVLASTANYLRQYGWVPGGDWSEGAVNWPVLAQWNKATVYQKTIAYMATELSR